MMDKYTHDKVNQIKSMINRLAERQIEIRKLSNNSSNEQEINRLCVEKQSNRVIIRMLNALNMIVKGMDYNSRIAVDRDFAFEIHKSFTVYIFETAGKILQLNFEKPPYAKLYPNDYSHRHVNSSKLFDILLNLLFPEPHGIFGQMGEGIQNDITRGIIKNTLSSDWAKYWVSKG